VVEDVVVKKLTFAISSPDEFRVLTYVVTGTGTFFFYHIALCFQKSTKKLLSTHRVLRYMLGIFPGQDWGLDSPDLEEFKLFGRTGPHKFLGASYILGSIFPGFLDIFPASPSITTPTEGRHHC